MPWLIFLSLFFIPLNAHSQEPSPIEDTSTHMATVEKLLNIEIAAYKLSSAFSAYVQFNGEDKFSNQLESSIQDSHQAFLNTSNEFPGIYKKWQQSLSFIESSKELVFEGADHRLVTGHAIYQNQLYQLIHSAQAEANTTDQDLTFEYLKTKVAFERVIAQYISFTGSATGFIHSDISIEESVDAFSSRIEKITNKNADFKRLNKKWKFIKGNMTAGSKQTTPFITLHTAADIRKTLKRIYNSELISTSDF